MKNSFHRLGKVLVFPSRLFMKNISFRGMTCLHELNLQDRLVFLPFRWNLPIITLRYLYIRIIIITSLFKIY